MDTINIIEAALGVVFSGGVGAVIAIVTLKAKIKKANSEAIEEVLKAKTSLMEFTEVMDVRMAKYVNDLQISRDNIFKMQTRHIKELEAERAKAELALEELEILRDEWEKHKLKCPLFQNRNTN